jgi:type I restriction-modification system DNA methylase subunit
MPLFQTSVLKKFLSQQDTVKINTAFAEYTSYFHNGSIQENIRNSKEEQFQEGFLRELFVTILGYTLNPTPNFNLTTEYKNIKDSKKADGAILIDDKVRAVIELKGTNTTDLGKIEAQAFGYKNNQPECVYVITSNFEKLRFYIDNAIEHIEFNLFQLSKTEFELLYLCLAYDNIKNNVAKSIKDQSVSEEDVITKKLYKDYSLFKRELFQNLVQLNPQHDPLALFQKSQKLLDRFLFIFFAEDRNLLPTNLIFRINKEWQQLQQMRIQVSLYDRYKTYFDDLNTGAKVQLPAFSQTNSIAKEEHQIFAYNGGLFKEDALLNSLIIDDAVLYQHTEKLSNYDFASEVDVNILGHIFENSLNELDEIKAQLEGAEIDKTKTKRKKDGVFYTPKYITKYIVENTVGKLCNEKKADLGIADEDYTADKKRQKKTIQTLVEKLDEYRKWLLQLTICDPACGSGAFLNQALDFLIAEHNYIDELQAKLFGDAMVLSDIATSILEHNLFGVDLNEESVEIAKLSLWLRTAQPNRKLNDLNSNIKCGNSLIDDPAVAGDKAFNWQQAFPEVFKKGGFDVIIGNPPYVFARDNFKQEEKDYFVSKYESAKYQINTYLLFIEKSVLILKDNGIYGLIIPNSWLMMYSGEGLRKFLLETNKLNQIINLAGYSFETASVETVILLAEKQKIEKENSVEILLNNRSEFYFSHSKKQTEFSKNKGFEFKVFLDDDNDELNSKINKDSEILDNIVEIKAGLQAYEKDKGEPKQTAQDVINRPYDYDHKFDDNTHKYLDGKDVGRYFTSWSGQYLKYGKHLAAPRTFNLFDGKKIIVREITGNYPKCIIATYNEEIYLYNRSNIAIVEKTNSDISLKYIIAVLNSKLLCYYFVKNTAKSVRKLFPKIILNDLRKFPMKKINSVEQEPFIEKADLMITLNENLQDQSQKFQRTIQRKFNVEDLPKKLQEWYVLSYADFIKELAKKKVKLTLSEEAEWEDYFHQESKKAQELKAQIDATDKAIDAMVYALYGLSEEEIGIVENS